MRLPNQSSGVRRIVFATSVYTVRVNWIDSAYGQIVPAQLPVCGNNDFTGCTIPTPNCPGGCMQECDAFTHVSTECCPAEFCGQSSDCCKQVCCEAKVV
jgi:hypothetical protein